MERARSPCVERVDAKERGEEGGVGYEWMGSKEGERGGGR